MKRATTHIYSSPDDLPMLNWNTSMQIGATNRLITPTLDCLKEAIASSDGIVHIDCHVIGSGDGNYFIAISDQLGGTRRLSPSRLSSILAESKAWCAIVLGCESSKFVDRLAVERSIAFVACDTPILDHSASVFSINLHKSLSNRKSLHEAVRLARRAVGDLENGRIDHLAISIFG